MKRISLVTILAITVLGACGSKHVDARTASDEPSATATSDPTEETTADSTTFAISQIADLTSLTAVVLEYRKNFTTPDTAGQRWDAIQVKMCNSAITSDQAPELIFSGPSWQLHDDDDGTYDMVGTAGPGFMTPEFSDKALPIGKCEKGWIYFEVPESSKITEAAFVFDNEDKAIWPTS